MLTPNDIKRSAAALATALCALPAGAETLEVICTVQEWCAVAQRAFHEATGIRVEAEDISADGLSNAEVLARVVNVGFAHLRNGEETAQLPVELYNGAMLQNLDDGTWCLHADGYLIVGLDGRRI